MTKEQIGMLKRVNKVLAQNDREQISKEDIEDYVNNAPKYMSDESVWYSSVINKGLIIFEIGAKKAKDSDLQEITYMGYSLHNYISYPMTESKIIDFLYWQYCVGKPGHIMKIKEDGTKIVSHFMLTHRDLWFTLDSFDDYGGFYKFIDSILRSGENKS